MGQAKALKLLVIVRCEGFDRGDLGPATLQMALEECRQGLGLLQPVVRVDGRGALAAAAPCGTSSALSTALLASGKTPSTATNATGRSRQALDHRFGVGLATTNMAESYARQGPEHWASALESVCRSLPILHEVGHRPQEIEALSDLAFLQRTMGDHVLAVARYEAGNRQPGGATRLASAPRRAAPAIGARSKRSMPMPCLACCTAGDLSWPSTWPNMPVARLSRPAGLWLGAVAAQRGGGDFPLAEVEAALEADEVAA